MRIFIQLLFITAIFFQGNAQETFDKGELIPTAEVPEQVRKSQEDHFPGAYVRNWELDRGLTAGDDEPVRYMSSFTNNQTTYNHMATYLPNGMLVYHSEFLPENVMPSQILMKVREDYDRFEVDHADLITLLDPKRQIYRVKLRDRALVKMAYYSLDGIPIPKNRLPEALLIFKY
jgi:hypothetical protein